MSKIGYISASLKEEVEEQSESLIASGCSKIYVEPVNNFNYQSKVKLAQVIEILKSKDTLAVTRLSILSSSVQTLLELMFTLEEKEIILEATKQQYISSNSYNLDELLFFLSEFIEDIRVENEPNSAEEVLEFIVDKFKNSEDSLKEKIRDIIIVNSEN